MKKRVLFDTNIILDFLLERPPFFSEAITALNMVSQGRVVGFISAHAAKTLFNILSRKVTHEKAKDIITDLLNPFTKQFFYLLFPLKSASNLSVYFLSR